MKNSGTVRMETKRLVLRPFVQKLGKRSSGHEVSLLGTS